MRAHLLILALASVAVLAITGAASSSRSSLSDASVDVSVPKPTVVVRVVDRYRGRSAREWAARYRKRTRQLQSTRALVHRRWQPTVSYALRLASAVSGVSYASLRAVSWCESHHDPYARNGRYRGIFQLGWAPFGFSPFDPVANALSAALTVRHDGSWRQWECKP